MRKTSLTAYDRIGEFKHLHYRKILRIMPEKNGINYELQARKAHLDKIQVARRLKELQSLKLIKPDGYLSLTSTGRYAANYIITPKGKRLIEKAA